MSDNRSDYPTSALHAGARLHLGLIEIKDDEPNSFGGIGIMVNEPSSTLEFQPGLCSLENIDIDCSSIWRERILQVCQSWLDVNNSLELPVAKLRLQTDQLPHHGLGSGTQISALIAHALIAAHANPLDPHSVPLNPETLRRVSRRGLRSHIGLAGYLEGGMIVDKGQQVEPREADGRDRLFSLPFPDWPILVIRQGSLAGDHGEREREMFKICSSRPNPQRQEMMDLITQELVPAVECNDWSRWDAHAGVYGVLAGKIFEQAQGGVFRTKAIQELVELLKELGCLGATQSSWGPAVLAVTASMEHALELSGEIKKRISQPTFANSFPDNLQIGITRAIPNHAQRPDRI